MSKYLTIGLPLIFLLIVGLVSTTFYVNKKISGEDFYSTNPSMEEVLGKYWKASFEGDQPIVNRVTSFPPENMFSECIGTKSNNPSEETGPMPEKVEIPEEFNPPPSLKPDEYKNPFTNEEIPGIINLTSEYIFVSRIPFNRIKIIGKKVYQNEGILEINIADHRGEANPNSEIVLFQKDGEGWKIIGFESRNPNPLVSDKIQYAIPKPNCE